MAYQPNPYLHIGPDRLYNPLTDRTILEGEEEFAALRALVAGEPWRGEALAPHLPRLVAEEWLVEDGADLSTRFLLKYVSLEGQTLCNQACYFCPVSIAPREDHSMPMELYESIVGQLAAYRATIEGLFMISYNEPTADKRFVEQVAVIREAGLPPAVLTNGTGLSPARTDRLLALGGLRFLSINLSTLDRERYRRDRGGDHLPVVLRNLDYLADKPVAEEMDMVVLGTGDETHQRDFEEIRERFRSSRFRVKSFVVNDRAGYLQVGLKAKHPERRLAGCDYFGSRPLQHLHITPRGTCILCCQDYTESVVVGDLTHQTVQEVLTGPALASARRQVYGIDPAPADHICRHCRYALHRG